MRRESKVGARLRKKLLETARRMTPEERLSAFFEHSRLTMELYLAGLRARRNGARRQRA